MLALAAEEREQCPDCGTPRVLGTDRALTGQWDVVRVDCEPCMALEIEAQNDHERSTPRGRKYGVIRANTID